VTSGLSEREVQPAADHKVSNKSVKAQNQAAYKNESYDQVMISEGMESSQFQQQPKFYFQAHEQPQQYFQPVRNSQEFNTSRFSG
jgi:hypothetical protein